MLIKDNGKLNYMKINMKKKSAIRPLLLILMNEEFPTASMLWRKTNYSYKLIYNFLDQLEENKRITYIKKGNKKIIIPTELLKEGVITHYILEEINGKYRIFGCHDDNKLFTKKA